MRHQVAGDELILQGRWPSTTRQVIRIPSMAEIISQLVQGCELPGGAHDETI